MKYKWVVILPCLFMMSSCVKEDRPAYRTEVIDGIKVVHNLAVGPESDSTDIQVIEELSLGVEEGAEEYMFAQAVDVDADSSGNIYVLDQGDCTIKMYDPEGVFVKRIGRKGQGPAEFERPSHLHVGDEGEIVVVDPYNRKFELLDREGLHDKTVRMEAYVNSFGISRKGSVLIGYSRLSDSKYVVSRLDLETGEVVEILDWNYYWPARYQSKEHLFEFPYLVRWAVDSNERIYHGTATEYEISVSDLDGNIISRFTKGADKVYAKGEVLKKVSEIESKGPNPFLNNPYYPMFDYMAVDGEGRLWIQSYAVSAPGQVRNETEYDVFSAEGIFLSRVKLPGHVYRPLVFKNGSIYALVYAEPGYYKASRLKLAGF